MADQDASSAGMRAYAHAYEAASLLSAAFSLLVVMTGVLYPNLMLDRRRPFSRIIFSISLADFLGSFGNSLAFPPNGVLCTLQSFLILYFIPLSWFLTTALVYNLHYVLLWKKPGLSPGFLFLSCLILALLPAVFPLISLRYGQQDSMVGKAVCSYRGNDNLFVAWYSGTYFAPLIISLLIQSFCLARLYCRLHRSNRPFIPSPQERAIIRCLIGYPLGMFVSWLPFVSIIIFLQVPGIKSSPYQIVVDYCIDAFAILSTQYGTMFACVFFLSSREARTQWMKFLGIDFSSRRSRADSSASDAEETDSRSPSFILDEILGLEDDEVQADAIKRGNGNDVESSAASSHSPAMNGGGAASDSPATLRGLWSQLSGASKRRVSFDTSESVSVIPIHTHSGGGGSAASSGSVTTAIRLTNISSSLSSIASSSSPSHVSSSFVQHASVSSASMQSSGSERDQSTASTISPMVTLTLTEEQLSRSMQSPFNPSTGDSQR